MRDRTVEIGGSKILIQERKIKELKALVGELLPETGGNLSNLSISQLMDMNIEDVLYKKLPLVFPGLTEENVDNAYLSELEAGIEAFIDVHFLGLKSLIRPLMNLAQAGAQAEVPPQTSTKTLRVGGMTRKR